MCRAKKQIIKHLPVSENIYQSIGVLSSKKYLNGSTTAETIDTNTYDELGRSGTKALGMSPLETLTYNYNIRGWLKGINRNYANNGGSNWFGEDISYDYGFNNPQVNGNISGVIWMSKGDPVSRAYGFNYDNSNRLLKGDFTQNDGSGYAKDAQVDFNVDSLQYDANGNILHLQQKGLIINTSQIIDYLQYSYLQPGSWSNRLASVSDSSHNTAALGDFKDGTNTGNDYAYDGNGIFDQRPGITQVHCMAHARRMFNEALDNDEQRASYALGEIQKLYTIERISKEADLNFDELKVVRCTKAAPILKGMWLWMQQQYVQVLPKSAIGKALAYSMERWHKLSLYITDGRLNIDNNPVENSIRPVALGRKNYLFAGSHDAARRSGMLYSLLVTCKMHGIEPYGWLKDVLHQIADHPINRIQELLPHRYKA